MYAVPFFFVTSGFLLFEKLKKCNTDNRDKTVKKYLVHIVRMYLIWCVIWIPWKVLHYYSLGSFGITEFVQYIRDVVFVSGGDALWYLPALATAIGMVYILRYKINASKVTVVILSLILYVVGCLISSWYKLFAGNIIIEIYFNIFTSVDNGILCGMVFVAIGMFIAENQKNHKVIFDAVCFVVLFSLVVIESYTINKLGFGRNNIVNNVMLPCTVFFMFRLILNIKIEGKEDIFRNLRDYSILIYLCHCFIIRSIKMLMGIAGMTISYTFLFIITLLLSFTFATFVRYIGEKKRYAWFKLLY